MARLRLIAGPNLIIHWTISIRLGWVSVLLTLRLCLKSIGET